MPNVAPLHANDLRRVGRYRLTGRIDGSPADGPVYLAATVNGTQVTLTLLDVGWVQTGAAKDRFTAEARAARRVPSFCTARIVDAGVDEGQAYLVREYVNGPSLAELVAEEGPRKDGSLVALAVGMATGLAAIHQAGLVHGHFGPEHVILGTNGPRVAGFGITPPYGAATPSADMLGWAHAVLYAATGSAEASLDLGALPEPLRGLVGRCAALDPAARPTAKAVVVELVGTDDPSADLLAEGSRQAVRAAFRPPAEPPQRERQAAASRSGAIWWVVGIAVCVVAIAVAVHVLQNQGSRPAASTPPPAPTSAAGVPTGGSSGGKSSTLTAPSASALPSAAAGSVPAALAGTWSGQVTEQSDVFTVQVKLTRGTASGAIRYSGATFACTGVLSLVSSAGNAVTMHQVITVGVHKCLDGTVSLSPGAPDAVKFRYIGTVGAAAQGALARQ
jgi:hypothetical protein